jgi:hypothetical protein
MVFLKFNLNSPKKSYDHFSETSGGGSIQISRVISFTFILSAILI